MVSHLPPPSRKLKARNFWPPHLGSVSGQPLRAGLETATAVTPVHQAPMPISVLASSVFTDSTQSVPTGAKPHYTQLVMWSLSLRAYGPGFFSLSTGAEKRAANAGWAWHRRWGVFFDVGLGWLSKDVARVIVVQAGAHASLVWPGYCLPTQEG